MHQIVASRKKWVRFHCLGNATQSAGMVVYVCCVAIVLQSEYCVLIAVVEK